MESKGTGKKNRLLRIKSKGKKHKKNTQNIKDILLEVTWRTKRAPSKFSHLTHQ